jgi:hypothetical protein
MSLRPVIVTRPDKVWRPQQQDVFPVTDFRGAAAPRTAEMTSTRSRLTFYGEVPLFAIPRWIWREPVQAAARVPQLPV